MNAEMKNGKTVLAEDNEQASLAKEVNNEKQIVQVSPPAWLLERWITKERVQQMKMKHTNALPMSFSKL